MLIKSRGLGSGLAVLLFLGMPLKMAMAFSFFSDEANDEKKADQLTQVKTTKKKRHRAKLARKDDLLVSLGTGLPIVSGSLGWGLDNVIVYRVSDDVLLFLGLDLGYYHITKENIHLDVFRLGFTGVFRYPVGDKTFIYGGLTLGPAFAHPSYNVLNLKSATKLTFLVRPGVEFVLSEMFSVSAELRMGVSPNLSISVDHVGRYVTGVSTVGNGFLIYPQINAILRF